MLYTCDAQVSCYCEIVTLQYIYCDHLMKFLLKFLYCLGKGKSKSKGEGNGEGQGHCQGHGQGSRVRVRLSRSGSICGVVRVKVGVAVIGYWLLLLL